MLIKPYEVRRERRLVSLTQSQKPDGLDGYFEQAVQKFRPYMYTIAFSFLKNQDDAEDAVGDALLKAYINLHGFTPGEREDLKIKFWLSEIIRNTCINTLRRHNEEESLEVLMQTGLQLIARSYDLPENAVLRAYATSMISNCLNTLSARDRKIVTRFVMLGHRVTDIAKDMGISRRTVYVTTDRVLRSFRHPRISRNLISLIRDF